MIKEVLWERRIVLVQTDVLRRNTSHFPFVGEITGELFNNRHLAGRLALNVKHPADASADEAYFYAFWGDDFFCRLRTRAFLAGWVPSEADVGAWFIGRSRNWTIIKMSQRIFR